MTSKTIDGVPRELLERIAKPQRNTADIDDRAAALVELRALLAAQEAPHQEISPGWPDALDSPMAQAIRAGHYDDTEFRALFDRMEQELKLHRETAARAPLSPDHSGGAGKVVLPEYTHGSDFHDESMSMGWNACLDKVKELNQ